MCCLVPMSEQGNKLLGTQQVKGLSGPYLVRELPKAMACISQMIESPRKVGTIVCIYSAWAEREKLRTLNVVDKNMALLEMDANPCGYSQENSERSLVPLCDLCPVEI